MICINNYDFYSLEELKDSNILNELDNDSKSNFIHNVKERLQMSKSSDKINFNNAYLVKLNNDIVGYVFLSQIKNNNIYVEYLIIKKFRGQGLATDIMNNLSDYIFQNNPNLESIHLSIDPSNINSINVANKLGFYCDEDSYFQDKLDFILDNPYYKTNSKLF